jgi:hypothetical protein
LIPLQPLEGNAWAIRCLSSCSLLHVSFPRVSRMPRTLLAGGGTHSEGVLRALKILLEPLAKAIPSQRSCNGRSGVGKLLHKASRGGGVCRTTSNHCTRRRQGQLRRRWHEENFHSYCIVSLQRCKTTQERGTSHSRRVRSYAIARPCLRLSPQTLTPQQTPRTKLLFSIPPIPKHIPHTSFTQSLATHRRNSPPLPHHQPSHKNSYRTSPYYQKWHPPARTSAASPGSATASAQRSTSGGRTCAAYCRGDARVQQGVCLQQRARVMARARIFWHRSPAAPAARTCFAIVLTCTQTTGSHMRR